MALIINDVGICVFGFTERGHHVEYGWLSRNYVPNRRNDISAGENGQKQPNSEE